MSDFKDKVVLVTGGAQGIGMGITEAFAEAGARVAVADVDREAIDEWVAHLSARHKNRVRGFKVDVGKEASVQALMDEIKEAWGKLHVLINNAGINAPRKPIDERPTGEWERVLAVNLCGPYWCTKYGLALMGEGAAIINIASTRAFMSEADTEPYSASKGGVVALTHSLAVSLAPRKIRVNCVSPGWIDVSAYKKKSVAKQEKLREKDHSQHPAGRVGKPSDVAEACLYLAGASFVTGTNLMVDGGMTIKMIYEE
jgi:NAD(P)-dependent dehydrogenase (short-subunit alcohol dehydrogenase family)